MPRDPEFHTLGLSLSGMGLVAWHSRVSTMREVRILHRLVCGYQVLSTFGGWSREAVYSRNGHGMVWGSIVSRVDSISSDSLS